MIFFEIAKLIHIIDTIVITLSYVKETIKYDLGSFHPIL
jgi:hypothetical protein